jgi:hypothetical protein
MYLCGKVSMSTFDYAWTKIKSACNTNIKYYIVLFMAHFQNLFLLIMAFKTKCAII